MATGGGDGWDSPKLVEIGGKDVEGCVFSNHFSKEDTSATVRNFVEKYNAKFGSVPDALASLAYDAATIGLSAIAKAGSINGEALKNAIKSISIAGVSGTITFDEKRNPIKSAVILKMENGTPEISSQELLLKQVTLMSSYLFQQLLNGIQLGTIYALIALGYTMVYGIIKLINFAHADIFMVGAYVAFFLVAYLSGTSGSVPVQLCIWPSVVLGYLVLGFLSRSEYLL